MWGISKICCGGYIVERDATSFFGVFVFVTSLSVQYTLCFFNASVSVKNVKKSYEGLY